MPKLKFRRDYLERLNKPIPKKEAVDKEVAQQEIQSQPRSPNSFVQYCMSCGKNQTFRKDTLGWKTCTVCRTQAPDRSQSAL
ncbi:MAG TPA: hypothetical protein VFV92_04660 [Candidatus Bathyarchaeia archaeon]|nr:hypothetical protein [Candidatus Bathyarchaeia archaeon]